MSDKNKCSDGCSDNSKKLVRYDLCSKRNFDLKGIETLLNDGWEPMQVIQEAIPVEEEKSKIELSTPKEPKISFVTNIYFKRARLFDPEEVEKMKAASKKGKINNVLNKK